MKTRIITAGFILMFFIPFVLFSHTPAYPVLVALLSFIAAYEVLRAFELEREIVPSILAYLLCVSMPIVAYVLRDNKELFLTVLLFSIFIGMILLFATMVFMHPRYKYSTISSMYNFLIYVVVSFSALSFIRNFPEIEGFSTFVMVFVIAWLTDVFAYFTGFFFGKHKLCPEISPKKTIEGAVGGVVFGTGAAFLFAFVMTLINKELQVNYISIAIFAPLLSVVSQLGDLFASAVKREREIKDYGYLLPGHGGIVDRFDSVLAVSGPMLLISLFYPMFI